MDEKPNRVPNTDDEPQWWRFGKWVLLPLYVLISFREIFVPIILGLLIAWVCGFFF